LHLSFYLKGKGLDTWYSPAYTELTHDQQRFTVTEVATDRQEKSSSIPSTNAENKHSVHHRICIKVRKTVRDQPLKISLDAEK